MNPPRDFVQRLRELCDCCDPIVVVDNGSRQTDWITQASSFSQVRLIRNQTNLGIAAASNQAIAELRRLGCEQALLLDHDSAPSKSCINRLAKACSEASEQCIGVVPGLRHPLPGMRCRWPQARKPRGWTFRFIYADTLKSTTRVDVAISSGMLLNLDKLAQLGDFREALFIDLVDTELCLRAIRAGYHLLAVPGAWMEHSIGTPQARALAGKQIYPTHHPATRHYYLARNRVHLYREYACALPFWTVYESLGAVKLLIKVVLFEPGRLNKLLAMLRGTLAGCRGQTGAAPFVNLDRNQ